MTRGNSPAEPERIMLVAAAARRDAVLLTVRGWPREDVENVMERIVGSLEIAVSRAAG
jgi:ATP-dependent protease Clp ATPase subunit